MVEAAQYGLMNPRSLSTGPPYLPFKDRMGYIRSSLTNPMRALLLVLVFGLAGRVVAQQPGTLDLSFDGDGKVILDSMSGVWVDPGICLVERPSGGVIVGLRRVIGSQGIAQAVALNEDGSLDLEFGDQGYLSNDSMGIFVGMVGLDNGGFLMVGWAVVPQPAVNPAPIIVQRYLPSGIVDQDYGLGGRIIIEHAIAGLSINTTKLAPDGQLFVAGSYGSGAGSWICRIDTEGSLDTSFGENGFRLIEGSNGVNGISFLSDGRINFIGYSTGPYRLPWSGQGIVSGPHLGSELHINMICTNIHDISIARGLDVINTFGEPGVLGFTRLSTFLGPSNSPVYLSNLWLYWAPYGQGYMGDLTSVGCDVQGNFLVGVEWGTSAAWRLYRIGSFVQDFDTSFGTSGFVETYFDYDGDAQPFAILSRSDGKVIVAGTCSGDGGGNRIVLARYHNIPDPRSTLSLRMFLGGAYDSTAFLMRDDLRQQGLIPTLQPYAAPFFSAANGVGTWATPQHVLQTEGDSAVVDWVWLELISATDSATVVATRVGLVHRDGWVTSADGHSPIDFSAGTGSYFVRARHRDHLGVTASQAVTLGPSVTTLDLTDPATPTFGTDAQKEINGVRMLWPGDANSDGVVKYVGSYNDRDRILLTVGGGTPTATLSGYRNEDLNLDGVVKYVGAANDRDIILQVIGGVPTGVKVEQRP